MTYLNRRRVLCGIAGVSASIAGCFGQSQSGGFTRTDVEDQELVVEFDESLEPDEISVVDPDGEGYAETSVSAGVTQETFELSMPYTPGEYQIIATQDGDEVAEATQEISPTLEILDVGVGANRMDEMPEELKNTKEVEALVEVKNSGSGPESIERLRLNGYLPSDQDLSDERTGIFDPKKGQRASSPVTIRTGEKLMLFTSTLPFTFEGDGVDCQSEPQSGEFTVVLEGKAGGPYSKDYHIDYSAAESYNGCEISISQSE